MTRPSPGLHASWRALAGVGVLAFALRVGYVALGACRPGSSLTPDGVGYVIEARNLAEHGVFSTVEKPPFAPDTVRTPGYPLFLALFCTSKGCPDLCAANLGQALLGAIAVLLCSAAALVLFRRPAVAGFAGLLLAFDLGSIFHGALTLTEIPFQCAFWLAFFALACAARLGAARAPLKLWLAGGVLVGAAALVRPIGLFYAPFAGAALFLGGGRPERPLIWRAALAVVVGSCVLPLLWAARNWTQAGAFTVTTLPARDMGRMRAAAVESQLTGMPFGDAAREIEREMAEAHGAPFASVEEEAEFAKRWGTRFVVSHPVAAAEVAAKDVVRVLGGHGLEIPCWQVYGDPRCDPLNPPPQGPAGSGTRALLSRHRGLRPFFVGYELYLIALYLLAVFGAVKAWRLDERVELGLALSPIVYFLLTSAGAMAYHRFRVALMPAVCVLAARGAAEIPLRRRRAGRQL